MATSTTRPIDPAFAAAFRREAGPAGALRFDAFMRLALYEPDIGYYRRDRTRVGRDRSTDFYTATSLGPVFGELVAAACANLLREATTGVSHAMASRLMMPNGSYTDGHTNTDAWV